MDDHTSELLHIREFDTQGFCPAYPLRRHRYECLANAGCHEARQDWMQYIGPVEQFGNCNPINGNFAALVLPLVKPERLRLAAYVLEYAFLHDNVVETISSCSDGDAFGLGEAEKSQRNVKFGRKQIQAKMMLQLLRTDKACAQRVLSVWKTMLSTTLEHKPDIFTNLEEYLDYRITDTGAPFVESVMLWGMGMTLTDKEDKELADVIRPCFASLALANDYFSFDREWEEAQNGGPKPTNAVWLFMNWKHVDISIAKKLVKEASNRYESRFLEVCDDFRKRNAPISDKMDRHLRGLTYQVSGNVVWSLNCPRYHPQFRYDANAGAEDMLTEKARRDGAAVEGIPRHRLSIMSLGSQPSDSSVAVSESAWSDSRSSFSVISVDEHQHNTEIVKLSRGEILGMEHVLAPFEYVDSLPSKGVRSAFIDALNLWCDLPETTLAKIKAVVNELHTASLMFDDIEDGSDFRRAHPAAHSVFGIAQTINAASFAITDAVSKANGIPIPGATQIVLEQLCDLHIGQSHDIYWTRHVSCPSIQEYLEMVSKKTGGLFRLLSRLMSTHLPADCSSGIDDLVTTVGLYFQIRDDYQNLSSDEYTSQKGFCEDLDEGKLSFPLVHCLNTADDTLPLREILQQRRECGGLNVQLKKLVLEQLKEKGSLEYTVRTLRELEGQIEAGIEGLEEVMGKRNWVLRLCMERLRV